MLWAIKTQTATAARRQTDLLRQRLAGAGLSFGARCLDFAAKFEVGAFKAFLQQKPPLGQRGLMVEAAKKLQRT